MFLHIQGLVAATHTPFSLAGELNLTAVQKQAEILAEGGVRSVFVSGTTGEGASLSSGERIALMKRWVEVGRNTFTIIAHVGHTSVTEAAVLAAESQRLGVHAIAGIAPYFFKPSSVKDLLEFSRIIAAAAPELPFYFYHLPSMTGVNLSMTEFFIQACDRIPTFAGLKFTHIDLMEYAQCLALAGGERDVLFGRDEILLQGLSAGAVGAIGSTYNYIAPLFHRLIAAFKAGDLQTARQHQAVAASIVELLRKYGEMAMAKAVMNMMGVDVGRPRSPLAGLSNDRLRNLYEDLLPYQSAFTRPLQAR